MDYRTDRRQAFIDWFTWSIKLEDCDSALYMTRYFFDRFEYNTEQRLWLSWLYGTTYHWPTAYVIWNEFPDMELVGVERLRDWNNENYKRLRYQTDTKWNKGHLPAQFESYKAWVGERTQKEAFMSVVNKNNQFDNFKALWEEVNGWHKFGRYSSWFYMQTLKQCCDLNIDVDSLWLHDYSGSRSHRNGLCYALGRDEWVNEKLDSEQIDYLELEGRLILEEVRSKLDPEEREKADFFAMETCLCSFKKLFRTRDGRYLGYYIDRQAEEIKKVQADGWEGIDWTPLWQAREETLDQNYLTNSISKGKMHIFMEDGIIDHHSTFTDQGGSVGLEGFMT